MKAHLIAARICLFVAASMLPLVISATALRAAPPGSAWESCEIKCTNNWTACLNNGNPSGRCGRHYDGCLARCKERYDVKKN
jgi:hypothetical protein